LEENIYVENGVLTKFFSILMNSNFPDLQVNKKSDILISKREILSTEAGRNLNRPHCPTSVQRY